MPVTVELDLVALRRWVSGDGPSLTEAPQLMLEARQFVGDVEIHRWHFVYDFSALVPPATVTPLLAGGDRIILKEYSRLSSPTVLLARGSDLADRMTDVSLGKFVVDVDNMTQDTPNVEVAVWERDHQPVLRLKPLLTADPDPIEVSAPGMLKPMPNLFFPGGDVVPGIKWGDLAKCDYAVANRLFLSNRTGIELQFVPSGTSDATHCEAEMDLRSRKGFANRNLNIFYVDQNYKPQNCCLQKVPEAMFITQRATPTSLAHELGHAFGLWEYGESGNIMLGDALERSGFTLPQVYLMMFGDESTLNMLGLRGPPTRNKYECPSHCKPMAFAEFVSKCVKVGAAFPGTRSPRPMGKFSPLLGALNSEESIPGEALFLEDSISTSPGLVRFLEGVARNGVQADVVNSKVRAIRALLKSQECPITADAYVKFYSERIVENSKRAAANALFALQTPKAKTALKEVRQFVSDSLREHIENLLLNWGV